VDPRTGLDDVEKITIVHCVDHILLKPRYVSVIEDRLQRVHHIKGKIYSLLKTTKKRHNLTFSTPKKRVWDKKLQYRTTGLNQLTAIITAYVSTCTYTNFNTILVSTLHKKCMPFMFIFLIYVYVPLINFSF
jgi:hypothetical protein